MARAAKVTIAEVEEIVEVGELPPDQIHLPSVYVHRLHKGHKFEKRIEVILFIETLLRNIYVCEALDLLRRW